MSQADESNYGWNVLGTNSSSSIEIMEHGNGIVSPLVKTIALKGGVKIQDGTAYVIDGESLTILDFSSPIAQKQNK